MLLLSIDSSAGASAALIRQPEGELPQVLVKAETAAPNAHAEWLAPAVQDLLAEARVQGADLAGVVVGVGPGPFTGLRVGLALGHALAEGWDVALHGVCSLDALALRAVEQQVVSGEFLVTTDARRREVYWARYTHDDGDAGLIEGPFVSPASEVPGLPAVGAGLTLYPEQLLPPAGAAEEVAAWVPHARELGLLAAGALTGELRGVLCEPRPLYLRGADAQVPRQMQRAGA